MASRYSLFRTLFTRSKLLFLLSSCSLPKPAASPKIVHDPLSVPAREPSAQLFEWQDIGPEAFSLAKEQKKFVLLHGAAVWCHWCHVMEDVTYKDAKVGAILRDHFVTIRVDIDSHPDIEERYEDWGWPATILLSPEAEEVGKYRGYIEPAKMMTILSSVATSQALISQPPVVIESPLPTTALSWVSLQTTRDLDRQYDKKLGSWGGPKKAPLGFNNSFYARRAARGHALSERRLRFTLKQQRALMDPVWGGLYQYSTYGDWQHPHYEKLMTFQAANLEAYAECYNALGDIKCIDDGKNIIRYVQKFLSDPLGGFYVSQDADIGTHDKSTPFINGKKYYPLPEEQRLNLGAPWVDSHTYAYETGLYIAALLKFYSASKNMDALEQAERAAKRMLKTHVDAKGVVRHDPEHSTKLRFLADHASLGRALAMLAQISPQAEYQRSAEAIAQTMLDIFAVEGSDALYASTPDPHAAGVFTRRRIPFQYNVLAARFLAALGTEKHRGDAQKLLAAASTPSAIAGQGRRLGEFLLAIDDLGLYPWAQAPARP